MTWEHAFWVLIIQRLNREPICFHFSVSVTEGTQPSLSWSPRWMTKREFKVISHKAKVLRTQKSPYFFVILRMKLHGQPQKTVFDPPTLFSLLLLPQLRPILGTSTLCYFSWGAGGVGGFPFLCFNFFSNRWVFNPPLLTLFYPQMKVEVDSTRIETMEKPKGNTPEIRNKSTRIQILASPFKRWVTLGKIT